ncbi:MAG: manganese efflux pump MntP family protein [Treponema sp.]|jgi:putative Mn2+ efflux pump MntP|nr:manganese efflux pump MntP family protein [Treponema sp.]
MTLFEIIFVAIGLSMDAFAISIAFGLSVKKPKIIECLVPGIYFGIFQAVMPLTGYFTGTLFAYRIQKFDHWAAFVLLGFIGGKMIKESFSRDEEKVKRNSFRFITMLLLAIATSIDALVVGITFAFFTVNIYAAVTIIGLTTFCISILGVKIGNIFGEKHKQKAEFVGGTALVLLGAKILIEHLFMAGG